MAETSPATIAILGGEGLRPESTPLWKTLIALTGSESPCAAVLPIALAEMPLAHRERRLQLTREHLTEIGITTHVIALDTVDQDDLLHGAKMVFLPGGEPRTVCTRLPDHPAWAAISSVSSPVRVLIASGGAAVALGDRAFAPNKPYPAVLDKLEFDSLPGLGLLHQTVILPYYSWLPDYILDRLTTLAAGSTLIGLDDQAAMISYPDGWQVTGMGGISIFREGRSEMTFTPGMHIPIDVLTPYPPEGSP